MRGALRLAAPRACSAYLTTLCVLAGLLKRVGIEASSNTENIGTFSIAYVAHKAASPIRFPPTVALTPVVAKRLFGKTDEELNASSEEPDASSE